MWIYEDGGAAEFMCELRQRWHAAHDEPMTTSTGGGGPHEPDPMPEGAVFVSCARGDRSAAERAAEKGGSMEMHGWVPREKEAAPVGTGAAF